MPDPSIVISKVLPRCEPNHSETVRITKVADQVKALVDSHVAGLDEIGDVGFGGSFAKGTWLPRHADIDIFFKIKPSVAVEKFEEMGRKIGSEALKRFSPKLRYSDHPYVEAFVNNIRVNVVPCYDVQQGKWQSAADRSPFHTQYILNHFDNEKRRQARLVKKFLRSFGIYGAEISTGGFSGYVSEVLVLKYSSLESLLRAAADWHERQLIAVSEYNLEFVRAANSPLNIIDPVDTRRNLGVAISPQSVAKFMLAARAFLQNPSVEFFKEDNNKNKRYHTRASNQLLPNVLIVEFSHQNKSPDIIWGQLKRSINAITKQLELAHFEVLRTSCITNEKSAAVLAFLLESITLPPYTKKKGPEIFRRKDTTSFLSKRKKLPPMAIWVDREMRIIMMVERKDIDARKFVKLLLHSRHENNGISRDLITSKLRIYTGSERNISGLAKEAIDEVVSTEHLIFR